MTSNCPTMNAKVLLFSMQGCESGFEKSLYNEDTVCPRSVDPFYIERVKTPWAYSSNIDH